MKSPSRGRDRGQALIQVLVGVALMGILMMFMMSYMQIMSRQQSQSNLTFQAGNFRNSIVSAINNANGWKNTYNNAGNNQASGALLDCIANSKPCTTDETTDLSAGGTPIQNYLINKVFDASNTVIYDGSTPNAGLTAQGTPCANFVDASNGPGNDNCPLRFEIRWWAKCNSVTNTCVNPQIQLQVVAKYNPSSSGGANGRLAFNPANYGTPVFLQGQDPNGACWVLNGTSLYETCATTVGLGTTHSVAPLTIYTPDVSQHGVLILQQDNTYGSPDQLQIVGGTNNENGFYIGYNTANNYANLQSWSNGVGAGSLALQANGGNVGIGMAQTSPSYTLDVNGSFRSQGPVVFSNLPVSSSAWYVCESNGTLYASSTCSYSDIRLKTNVRSLDHALDKIDQFRAIRFDWKDKKKYGNDREIGVVAQDFEKDYPELVLDHNADGFKSFKYQNFTAVLLEATKELYHRWVDDSQIVHRDLAAMRSDVIQLKAENENLKREAAQKSKEIAELKAYLCKNDTQALICK